MAMILTRKHIGDVSIESGRLLVIDPIYLRHWQAGEYRQEEPSMLNSYDEACKVAGSEPWHGRMFDDAAVIIAPPDGDGSYPVYGYFTHDGLCVKLDIVLGVEAVDWQDALEWEFHDVEGLFSGIKACTEDTEA